jgi:hypothetical protein
MQTRTLISLLKRETDWSRPLIRSVVSEVYKLIMQKPLEQTRLIDSSTGKDPLFNTTKDTYEYSADTTTMPNLPADAWLIDKVYSGVIGNSSYDKKEILPVQGDYSNAAKFYFKTNPATESNGLYIRAFRKLDAISSEDVELLYLPENMHLTVLYEGTMAWIEKTDSGKSKRWDDFIDKKLPKAKHGIK